MLQSSEKELIQALLLSSVDIFIFWCAVSLQYLHTSVSSNETACTHTYFCKYAGMILSLKYLKLLNVKFNCWNFRMITWIGEGHLELQCNHKLLTSITSIGKKVLLHELLDSTSGIKGINSKWLILTCVIIVTSLLPNIIGELKDFSFFVLKPLGSPESTSAAVSLSDVHHRLQSLLKMSGTSQRISGSM